MIELAALLPILRTAIDLAQKLKNREIQDAIVSVQAYVLETNQRLLESQQKISSLEKALEFAKQLHFENGAYWAGDEPDPYCSRCWEATHQAVHMHISPWETNRPWICPSCKTRLLEVVIAPCLDARRAPKAK